MWQSVTLDTDAAYAERLADALLEAGAIYAGVEDAQAGTAAETPQFGEPGSPTTPLWQTSRISALFDPAPDLAARIEAALQSSGVTPTPHVAIGEVAEQDWVRLTQVQFEPIRIDARLWIVPSWHVAPDADATNLVLDPGLAFGTGSHPTTHLCLQWLCAQLKGGERVLDYGCGSGILGIAAARLGAGTVTGVDIDDNALIVARDNAARNRVALDLRHSAAPLDARFDIVIANILTNPLCVLAPLLAGRLLPGGRLVLSGVLAEQAGLVREAYAPHLALVVGAEREGWVRLEGRAAC